MVDRGPRIEEEWRIEATRLHPSGDGSDRRVRHTRLKPTDNLPNALSSSFEGTHAYHLERRFSYPIFNNFSQMFFFYPAFIIV